MRLVNQRKSFAQPQTPGIVAVSGPGKRKDRRMSRQCVERKAGSGAEIKKNNEALRKKVKLSLCGMSGGCPV